MNHILTLNIISIERMAKINTTVALEGGKIISLPTEMLTDILIAEGKLPDPNALPTSAKALADLVLQLQAQLEELKGKSIKTEPLTSTAEVIKIEPKKEIFSLSDALIAKALEPDNGDYKNRFRFSENSESSFVIAQNKLTNKWVCNCEEFIEKNEPCEHLKKYLPCIKEYLFKNSSGLKCKVFAGGKFVGKQRFNASKI